MKTCMLIAGTRPNFVKIAPLYRAFVAQGVRPFLVHTGQHFDTNMSDVFFADFELPAPDVHLGISGGDRISQTRAMIAALEPVIASVSPSVVVVVGDVTSTIAATIAAMRTSTPVVHVEAGLRSHNMSMPEEVNRIFVDHYSDMLFATEPAGVQNLLSENISASKVHLVGNVMIDTLLAMQAKCDASRITKSLRLEPGTYAVITLHRPQNVDTDDALRKSYETVCAIAAAIPVVFPMHPRTRAKFDALGVTFPEAVLCAQPLSYVDMIALTKRSACVLTDSGGIQEEATVLGIPCITLRTETERPITVTEGTNEVVDISRLDDILAMIKTIQNGQWKKGSIPELWDGHAAERIVRILEKM